MPQRRNDIIDQFYKLRDELTAERKELRARLAELDRLLGGGTAAAPAASASAPAPAARRNAGRTPRSEISLKDAITKATASKPLGMADLVDAVQKLGFRFRSSNPKNSLGAYLYGPAGKKHFKKSDEGFSAK